MLNNLSLLKQDAILDWEGHFLDTRQRECVHWLLAETAWHVHEQIFHRQWTAILLHLCAELVFLLQILIYFTGLMTFYHVLNVCDVMFLVEWLLTHPSKFRMVLVRAEDVGLDHGRALVGHLVAVEVDVLLLVAGSHHRDEFLEMELFKF